MKVACVPKRLFDNSLREALSRNRKKSEDEVENRVFQTSSIFKDELELMCIITFIAHFLITVNVQYMYQSNMKIVG